jgi:pyruvate/2-oxoglutarate dehydrogenase complex dihydrolipoamide dehydrogenase (E3) component
LPHGIDASRQETRVGIDCAVWYKLSPGPRDAHPLTHINAIELGEFPEHLLLIIAGYVGLELSQSMRRFGSTVTMFDRNSALLHHEDHEVSEGIATLFREEEVGLTRGARVQQVSGMSSDAICQDD